MNAPAVIALADGTRLAIKVAGPEGAPSVTLLHSLATDGRLWAREAALLAPRYRVLRIDLRGHGGSAGRSAGGSDAGGDAFTIAGLADDVLAVWAALGIARSAVIGLSIGGMIALTLGLARPDAVPALVAADCRADAPPPFRAMWDARRRMLADEGIEAIVAATLPSWFTPAALAAPLPAIAEVATMIRGTSVAGYVGATRALQGLDLLGRLPGMTVPVRYIVGADDGLHPAAMRAMQARTPGSDLIEIAGAAHLANLERPEAFAAAVLPFLAERWPA